MKWFLYRMEWDASEGKYQKQPCTPQGQPWEKDMPEAQRWSSDRALVERHLDSLPQEGVSCYWLGMRAEPHEKLFFLDLDHVVQPDGTLDPVASRVVHPFLAAGAYFEGTSSGTGVHVIGSYTGDLPEHCAKRPTVHTYEFYTTNQGMAINRRANSGHWSVDCTAIVHSLIAEWFPARAKVEDIAYDDDKPREDWDGPTDDDELLRKALGAKGSAAASFGQALTFAQLWNGQCEKNNETDLALASHLAFWTGCHATRIERLMRRSGLFRDKWNSHRTYLRELTIDRACRTTKNVYKQIRVVMPAVLQQAQSSDVDWHQVAGEWCERVHACGDLKELVESVMPQIGALGIPVLYSERVVQALSKRLQLFDSKVPLPKLRSIVNPPRVAPVDNNVVIPDWAAPLCYVNQRDKFMDISNGSLMSAEGLRMTYASKMPFKPNGTREDVVMWARERWNIPVVDDVLYRPDQEAYFTHNGLKYANLFNAASMPEPAAPSAECAECIQLFMQHLWLMSGQRKDVYMSLLLWIAHNVQKPGRKIRWSPLIKGVPGDGKSILLDLFSAVMGGANVKLTSPSSLTNSGGFTDWATGKAINVIEEIRLFGKERHTLFNAMKNFIGDTLIDLNRKGRVSGDSMVNITNHLALTNYENGMPLPSDNSDRRWMVVFSPYTTIDDAVKAKGLQNKEALVAQFARMGSSMRQEPGAWRAWLQGADLAEFDPDARAPHTDEREVMAAFSEEPVDALVREVIENGGPGITVDVFSSTMLRRALKVRAQLEDLQIPNGPAWHTLLSDLGYRPWTKPVKIGSLTQRLWIKRNFHGDPVEIVKATVTSGQL